MYIDGAEDLASRSASRERLPAWAGFALVICLAIIGVTVGYCFTRSQAAAEKADVLEARQADMKEWMQKVDTKLDKLFEELHRK